MVQRPEAEVSDRIIVDSEILCSEQFEQILEEWAEMVYDHLCQLQSEKILVTETSLPIRQIRTGTNAQ